MDIMRISEANTVENCKGSAAALSVCRRGVVLKKIVKYGRIHF